MEVKTMKTITYNLYQEGEFYGAYDESELDEVKAIYRLLKETNPFDEIKLQKETCVIQELELENNYEEKDFKNFVIDLIRKNKSLKNEIDELSRDYEKIKEELQSRPSSVRGNY